MIIVKKTDKTQQSISEKYECFDIEVVMTDIKNGSLLEFFTSHETVLFVDRYGQLVHGRATSCRPQNLRIVESENALEFFHVVAGEMRPIRFLPQTAGSSVENSDGRIALKKIPVKGDSFALGLDNLFLSANPSGELMLAVPHIKEWEMFHEKLQEPNGLPSIAAFTMAFNEDVFLPMWANHYSRHVGIDNLFIIDHGSTDSSIASTGVKNVIRLPRGPFDENKRCRLIASFQEALLSHYDAVIFSDADEMLVPDPLRYDNLREFAKRRCHQFCTAIGVNVLHFTELESALNLGAPILAQRKYARFSAEYCKSLLSEIPLRWTPGFHACQYKPRLDNDLFLFHLKLVDRELALHQLKKNRSIEWSENAIKLQHGVQFRFSEEEFVAKYYPRQPDDLASVALDFDFSKDSERFRLAGVGVYQNFQGTLAEIPARFSLSIPKM